MSDQPTQQRPRERLLLPMRQARYWLLTIPRDDWEPQLPAGVQYVRGQPELGETGYRHWQLVAHYARPTGLPTVKSHFGNTCHAEPTRSDAAREYVWKEATRDGEQFEFGELSLRRNQKADWDAIKSLAKAGNIDMVPSDIFVRYYRTLVAIASDHERPEAVVRKTMVYYGATGTGKSRRAWDEAGPDAYCKDPRSKFWCGYQGQQHVIVDEFRGGIDISHMLRWLDRYPVRVEIKGSSRPLRATKIWITSNVHPMNWYIDLDAETKSALLRRLEITEFQ